MQKIIKIFFLILSSFVLTSVYSQQQIIFRTNPVDVNSCINASAQFEALIDTLYYEGEFEIVWQYKKSGFATWTDVPANYPFDTTIFSYNPEIKGIRTILSIVDLDETFKMCLFKCTLSDSTSDSALLQVNSLPDISFTANAFCFGDITQFTNTSADSSNIVNWEWDFEDGQISSLQHPGHYYSETRVFSVSLIGIDQNNCSNTSIENISILELPEPEIAASKIVFCLNESNVLFRCEEEFYSYSWMIETSTEPIKGIQSTILFDCDEDLFHPGQFSATLTVGDTSGCFNSVNESFLILSSKVPQDGKVHQKEKNSNLLVLLIENEEDYEYYWFAYDKNNINDTIENSLNKKPYHLFVKDIDIVNYEYGVEVRSKNSECSTVFLFE